MGCLLTGIELFPGNIQGGSDTPAGWAKGHSIDQEIRTFLQSKPETRTRFGSLEFGVMVPDKADTWTRMVYAGPNKPLPADRRPVPDVFQASTAVSRTRPRSGASSTTCKTTSRRSARR